MFHWISDLARRIQSLVRQPIVWLQETRTALESARLTRVLNRVCGIGWSAQTAAENPSHATIFNRYLDGSEPVTLWIRRSERGWSAILYDHRYVPAEVDPQMVSERDMPFHRAVEVIPIMARLMVSFNTAHWEFLQKREEQRRRQESVYEPFAMDTEPIVE